MVLDTFDKDANYKIVKSSKIISIDFHKIEFPLILRQWQNGDWFIPIGMKGKKKLSDFFSDNKFSLFDKENTWLLCSGDDIVSIVGYRPDDRFKVTDETKAVLQIKIEE